MRMIATAALFAASCMLLLPQSRAAELQYGRNGVTKPLPNLGPAGNGRRKWVEFQCYMCHGANGGGQFGPNIQQAEAGDVSEAVRQGIPEWGMPSYGKYATAADVANLTAYLHSVGTAKEPKWWDWWEPHPQQ